MARNRYNNSVAQAGRSVYSVELSHGERLIISWLLGQMEGLDKEGSRKTAAVIEELDLEGMGEVTQENMDEVGNYTLSGYEIRFIIEQMDAAWESRKVKAVQARHAVSMYDNLKAAMEAKEEPVMDVAE